MKRFFKNLWSVLLAIAAWCVVSSIFWGWVINLVTDTVPAKKVVIFIEAEKVDELSLEEAMAPDLPERIKMAKVHSFSYAMFDAQNLLNADVYIIKASKIEEYSASLSSDAELPEGKFGYSEGGDLPRGVKVYDAATGEGYLKDFVNYYGDEDCYLFIGASSPHIEDGAAGYAAKLLLEIQNNGGKQ